MSDIKIVHQWKGKTLELLQFQKDIIRRLLKMSNQSSWSILLQPNNNSPDGAM